MPIPSHPEHYRFERALVVIKPDGVQRSLIGEVLTRYERVGLKLVAMRMRVPDEALVRAHYQLDPEWTRKVGEKLINSAKERGVELDSQDPLEHGERILLRLVRYMTSGPVVSMVWQGAHAVDVIRKITGGTEPRTSDVGTVRGDFMLDSYTMANADERSVRNIVHASGTVDEANAEINLWFTPQELLQYRLVQEEILYDVNLDGLLE